MNKNINTVVEQTEKELECVAGGMGGMKVSRVLEGAMMLGTIAVLVPAVSVMK